ILDLFTSEQRTLESARGGLWIGPALVRHLVALHGGTSEARRAGIDQGSEFTVQLPKLSLPVRLAETQNDRQNPPAKMVAGLRILVADDNADSAMSLTELLRLQGHQVQTAHDGKQAVEIMGVSR